MCINASLPHTTLTGMQEKLLNKPPFRYIHDIVMAIRKQTGFLEGLFDEDQMVGKAIKDKHAKVAFFGEINSLRWAFLWATHGSTTKENCCRYVIFFSPQECKPCWLYFDFVRIHKHRR